ncbi:MAG: phosphatidylinositol-specific phospholipase C1-like protein [Janthinobacterium lividum]
MKLTACAAFAVLLFPVSSFSQQSAAQDNTVRLNQIQVIGTHNSYNNGFAPSEAKWLQAKNPKAFDSLEYSHKPLPAQFDSGVRQIEIDIASDPQGGRYAHPRIVELVQEANLPADPDFDPQHLMDKPGLKVLHVVDINQRSSCQPLVACLQQVRDWSNAHPKHVPIFVLLENKSGATKNIDNAVEAPQFTAADFDELDREIRTVFQPGEMIVPDEVRGTYPTLEAGVLAGNWPTLAASRGKVVFLMDQRKSSPIYAAGHPSLKGRVLFTNAVPGEPEAAFTEQNDGSPAAIDALVKRGYLVRARTDAETVAARSGDTHRRDDLLHSGAQFLSTDYPASEPSKWTGYSVALPGGLVARCNPVNAPKGCVDAAIEPK